MFKSRRRALLTGTMFASVTSLAVMLNGGHITPAHAIDVDANLNIINNNNAPAVTALTANVTSAQNISGPVSTTGLNVGNTAQSTVVLQNSAVLSNTTSAMNLGTGSVLGGMLVNFSAVVNNDQDLNIGQGTYGHLEVSNGGQFNQTSGTVTLGVGANSTGEMVINFGTGQPSSLFTTNGDMTVGAAGTGMIDIGSNGRLEVDGNLNLAQSLGSTGTIELDGSGAELQTLSNFSIGVGGAGTLNVKNGGVATTAALTIGEGANSNGTLSITSGGSVVSGATAAVLAIVGDDAGATGVVNISGTNSNWTHTGSMVIGDDGNGSMTVSSGAYSTISNSLTIGSESTSTGTLNVNSGSSFNVGNSVQVADNGNGTLIVSGSSTLTSGISSSSTAIIGTTTGSNGSMTVTDAGSSWSHTGGIQIANTGTGSLTVGAGAAANFVGDAEIGVNANSNGSLTIDGAGSQVTLTSNIEVGVSGDGSVVISNGGVLVTNAISSGTSRISNGIGSTGMVTIAGSGSTWSHSGDIQIGSSSIGSLTIAEGGSLSVSAGADEIVLADNNIGTGTINIGGASGSSAAGSGLITASQITAGSGNATLNFNHTDTNYDFSIKLDGSITLNNTAGVTKLTGDMSSYNGAINVNGGSLFLNTTIANAASITTQNGGIIGGAGMINTLTAQNGGIIAPGNSIGTLTVTGNASFGTNSIYQVEVDGAGNSDLLDVGGTLTIAPTATVSVSPENGTDDGSTYTDGQVYTIATATGGVTGTFASVSENFAFLSATLGYTANSVTVTLSQAASFNTVATTSNQTNIANAVEALGNSNEIYSALLGLSASQAQTAFDSLSGEVHSSIKSALINDSRYLRQASLERTDLDLADGNYAWGQAYGGFQTLGSNSNAADTDVASGGLIAGLDSVQDDWQAGIAIQIGRSNTSVGNGRSSDADSSDYGIGAYGAVNLDQSRLAFGASFISHDIETTRNISVGSLSQTLTGDYSADTTQIFAKWSTELTTDAGIYTPFAQIAHVSHHSDGFSETGGSAALSTAGASTDTTYALLGVSADRDITLDNGAAAKLHGKIGWQHAFNTSAMTALSFAGGNSFGVEGSSIAENALVLDAGMDVNVSDTTILDFKYSGQIGSGGSHAHSFSAGLSVKF